MVSSWALRNGWCVMVCMIWFSSVWDAKASVTMNGTVFIDGKRPVATTDENFVCATLDLWPPDRCDNGICSWGRSSLLNLDLKNGVLFNAIKAFSPLRIRLGGTLQDRLIYQTRNLPCTPFVRNTSQLFNYTEGCLPLARWDELNSFFNRTGAVITFGLNALRGKTIRPNNTAVGPWDPRNAGSLIRYTVKKGYNVYGWEFGNELGGRPIVVGVPANPYATDTMVLHGLIQRIYNRSGLTKPLILAPGGIFESDWFKNYIARTAGTLNVITHHIYNLGSGLDEQLLIGRIFNASFLDSGATLFQNVHRILRNSKTSTVAWVSEAGGVFNSGRDGVTNTFIMSFWYLDQLGLSSIYGTKSYCRQSLVGGNYGLLNTTTFVPNPDYYSALLWHRLMGKHVLSTKFGGTRMIRAYAHCAKQSKGISVLLMNLDGNNTVHAKLHFNDTHPHTSKLIYRREEYHLSPMDGNIRSRTVLLNGKALIVGSSGAIPALKPITVSSSEAITVNPRSIVFVHIPNVAIPACR